MFIVLFRHGPAGRRDASRWPDDEVRPLSPKGEARTRAAARGLRGLVPRGAHVVTSPLVRAEQTARVLEGAIQPSRFEVLDALAPGGSYRKVVEWLGTLGSDETVVLVGHEPDLGRLAGVLLFGAPRALPLKKAGACGIEFVGEPTPGEGVLTWFLPPRALRELAGKKRKA
jgi:phosphohistidine phosphatase